MKKLENVSFLVMFLSALLLFSGGKVDPNPGPNPEPNPAPTPDESFPVAEEGRHYVLLRQKVSTVDRLVNTAINSGVIKDEIEDNGGNFVVFFDNEDASSIPARYLQVFNQMKTRGAPHYCVCDSKTGLYYVGPVESEEKTLEQIKYVFGGV